MSVGITDNISALYQLQQSNRKSDTNTSVSSSPDEYKRIDLSKSQKMGIGLCSAIGLAASLMLLAKFDKSKKYTINPLKMFRGNIKDSYIISTRYKTKEVVTMGAGSIIGGLVGGALFDKKDNFESKIRESIVQISNITFPIALVEGLTTLGKYASNKIMPNWNKSEKFIHKAVTNLPPTVGAVLGLGTGMFVGNRVSNKFNEKMFHKKDDRPVKWKDLSAHVDDIGVAATFVAPDNPLTKLVSKLIPAALFVPGYETGIKKECVDLKQNMN